MADDTEELPDSRTPQRMPVTHWLRNKSVLLGTTTAVIASVIVLFSLYADSPAPNAGNTVLIEGDNEGGLVAGGDINNSTVNARDPLDRKIIESLLADKARLEADNAQLREQVTDAVTGLSDTDSEPSQIEQAEAALAQGNTALAQALYKADAENKTAAGETQLQAAAQSYRRLGALAYLDDTAAALEAYQKAVEAWPDDIRAWDQLGHLYRRTGQLEQAIEAYGTVGELADSTDEPQVWTAISLGSLGIAHNIRGELDDAVAMYEKALALNTELGRKQGMAKNYGNLGNVHRIRGELDQAVAMYEKALALNTELGRKQGMAKNYGNLGNVHRIRGELDQARQSWEQSVELFDAIGSPTADKVRSLIDELDTDK